MKDDRRIYRKILPFSQYPFRLKFVEVYKSIKLRLDFLIIFIILILSIISFIILTETIWNYTMDDAFITFRYSENIVKGWGITFNQPPPRAEGYSSILWVLILILPHIIHVDVVEFSKVFGICMMIATIGIMAYCISYIHPGSKLKNRQYSILFSTVLFISFPASIVHPISGMETSLACFLFVVTTVFFLLIQSDQISSKFLPLICLVLGLTRPEANLYSMIILLLTLFNLPRYKRTRFIILCLVSYVLPGIVYFVWRFRYYRILFPLPFYIKQTSGSLAGFASIIILFVDLTLGVLFPLYVYIKSVNYKRWVIFIPIISMLGYFITVEPIMAYGNRYLYPLVPILTLLAGIGLLEKLESHATLNTKVTYLLCLTLGFGYGLYRNLNSVPEYLSYARGMQTAHILLGKTLGSIQWASPKTIAISDAGAVPYYSELTTIDTNGLNDKYIALNFLSDRSEYVLEKHPTIMVFVSKNDSVFESRLFYEDMLYQNAYNYGYTNHATFVFSPSYFLWVVWNPHIPNEQIINNTLHKASELSYQLFENYSEYIP